MTYYSDDNRDLYRPQMSDEKRRELEEAVRRSEGKRNFAMLREALNKTPERKIEGDATSRNPN